MFGDGSGGILEALPMPLGSTVTLFNPPTFAGPGAIPLMGTLPVPAAPAIAASDAVDVASTATSARTIFAEVLAMTSLRCFEYCVSASVVILPIHRRH